MANLKGGTRPPWVGLGAAVWLQIATGNAYNFPLYSHSLKSVLGFNQHQLTMLGVANDVGENVGLLPGYVCNKLPPWAVLLIGALACFSGYGVLYLAVSQIVESLPYWLLWLALCIATNSSAWFSTTILVTNMRNFPVSRGTVAGILKGYGGLIAAVFTEIYSVLLRHSSSKLLAFLSIGIPLLCIALMYFVGAYTPASGEDASERGHFLFIQAASIVLGLYLLTTTILDDVLSLTPPISFSFIIIVILLLVAPLAIPVNVVFLSPLHPLPLCRLRHSLSPEQDASDPIARFQLLGFFRAPPLFDWNRQNSIFPAMDRDEEEEAPVPSYNRGVREVHGEGHQGHRLLSARSQVHGQAHGLHPAPLARPHRRGSRPPPSQSPFSSWLSRLRRHPRRCPLDRPRHLAKSSSER